jgi:hypothetical protein
MRMLKSVGLDDVPGTSVYPPLRVPVAVDADSAGKQIATRGSSAAA